jgi:ubiquinone biosynthesis protein
MEYIDGVKAGDGVALREQGYDLSLVASRGANLIMEQIFVHGFFHADPHPGNILVMEDSVICFIDFGQMGRLSLKEREDFTDLVLAIIAGDERKVTTGVLKMTIQHGEIDRDALGRDLGDFVDQYVYKPLGEIAADRILQDILDLVTSHSLALRPNLYLMMKALATVEGLGLRLDPELELITLASPFMRRVKQDQFKPKRLAEDMGATGAEYLGLFRDLPEDLGTIIKQFKDGRVRVELEHRGFHMFGISLDRISNRIAFAIVLAAQIIGSSLIVLSDIPPKWHGIPLIGIIGFLFAGMMGFWLLLSIIKHGRM